MSAKDIERERIAWQTVHTSPEGRVKRIPAGVGAKVYRASRCS